MLFTTFIIAVVFSERPLPTLSVVADFIYAFRNGDQFFIAELWSHNLQCYWLVLPKLRIV